MYHVSAQGVDEHMINVHYFYYYYCVLVSMCPDFAQTIVISSDM